MFAFTRFISSLAHKGDGKNLSDRDECFVKAALYSLQHSKVDYFPYVIEQLNSAPFLSPSFSILKRFIPPFPLSCLGREESFVATCDRTCGQGMSQPASLASIA